jgi:hypothetical protein
MSPVKSVTDVSERTVAIDIADCKIDVPNWGLAMADR